MNGFLHKVRFKYLPVLIKPLLKIHPRDDLEKLGSGHGQWIVPTGLINASSVCYCVGVGGNISFDLDLIKRFGCDVHAFDPTPRAVEYIHKISNELPDHLHFHPVGLWSEDTTLRFFFSGLDDGMFSAVDIKGTSRHVECPVKRLATLMDELGHDHVDVAKIDIEGAEYEVIDNLVSERISPTVLCIEFDQPMPVRRTFRAVRQLTECGYTLVCVDLWNYTFVMQ